MNKKAVRRGQELVAALNVTERGISPVQWELADLSAANVATVGGDQTNPGNRDSLTLSKWAEEIGWEKKGYEVSTLQKMVSEARNWPEEDRYDEATFWQHEAARGMFKDTKEARAYLVERITLGVGVTQRPGRGGKRSVSIAALTLTVQNTIADMKHALDKDIAEIEPGFQPLIFSTLGSELMDIKERIEDLILERQNPDEKEVAMR